MNRFQYFRAIVDMLDITLNTKRRRHLVGGGLLGMAFLFGTFALTVMTAQSETMEEHNNGQNPDEFIDIFGGMPDRSVGDFCDPEETF